VTALGTSPLALSQLVGSILPGARVVAVEPFGPDTTTEGATSKAAG